MSGKITHGHAPRSGVSPEYRTWAKMMERCYGKKNKRYHRYGGRGIKVCKRWHLFENFFMDMGRKPLGMSIERKDNDGDYKPGNCRWATIIEQANNTSRNFMVTHGGRTLSLSDWSRVTGIRSLTIRARIVAYGWSAEKALTKKTQRWGR